MPSFAFVNFFMWFIELSIVLLAILLGMRLGGIGLGVTGGLGLLLLYLFFSVVPVNPPFEVILIIIAIILAVAVLEYVGALDLLTNYASCLLAYRPNYITWISPLISYVLVFFTGTGHVVYSLLPVIVNLSKKHGIRPERPLVATVIASQQAIIASPFTGATAIILMQLSSYGYSAWKILLCLIPASIVGTLAAAWLASKQGKEVDVSTPHESINLPELNPSKKKKAQIGLLFFGIGILGIVGLGIGQHKVALFQKLPVSLGSITAMVMLSTAALILLGTRSSARNIAETSIFRIGMQAIIALLGIAWMSNSFLYHHLDDVYKLVANYGLDKTWQWGIIFFLVTIISTSQGTTLQIILPILLTCVDLDKLNIMAILPAANSVYFISTYPPMMAAAAVDTTGSTRVGSMLFNHSFLLAGVVGTIVTCIVAGIMQYWLF